MTRIPISDPKRAVVAQRDELMGVFDRFLESGWYIHGPEHAAFEEEFARFIGARHCVGVASGTDALELALLGVGCGEGDEVVTAANCGGYTTTAARRVGLRVRFADVDETTLCLSGATVEEALTPSTKVVVVTHLYGLVADVEAIVDACRRRDIRVVEDCAQAAGAGDGTTLAGAFGDVGVFSFYPTKNLAALGDGGAVVTNGDDIAGRVRLLRQYGWNTKYRVSAVMGRNSRLDELQAAVIRSRLPRLQGWNARRRAIVQRYADALAPEVGHFVLRRDSRFVGHLAVAVFDDREKAREILEQAGISTDVHYPIADHQQPAWRDDYAACHVPVTERAVMHVLTVPCFPELTDGEVERICEVLHGL